MRKVEKTEGEKLRRLERIRKWECGSRKEERIGQRA
jgi:hypothetical protein